MHVAKDDIIADLMSRSDLIAPMLFKAGMYCIICPAAQLESLEEACMVHGIDADSLVENMNEVLADIEENPVNGDVTQTEGQAL